MAIALDKYQLAKLLAVYISLSLFFNIEMPYSEVSIVVFPLLSGVSIGYNVKLFAEGQNSRAAPDL